MRDDSKTGVMRDDERSGVVRYDSTDESRRERQHYHEQLHRNLERAHHRGHDDERRGGRRGGPERAFRRDPGDRDWMDSEWPGRGGGRGGRGDRGGRGSEFGRGRPGRPGRGRGGIGALRAAVLTLLEDSPRHAYQVITELAERSGGLWRPSPGSVYPLLSQLVDEGLVSAEEVDGRRRYSLTEAGTAWVEKHRARIREAVSDAVGPQEAREKLMPRLHEVMGALRQALDVATPAQQEQLADLLVECRRRIYQILGTDAGPEADGEPAAD